MKHGEVRSRLGPYLEGDLPLQQRALVDAHLDTCPSCGEELKELRETIGLLRSLPEIEPPVGLANGVMARIHAGEAQSTFLVRLLDGLEMLLPSRSLALVATSVGVLVLALLASGRFAEPGRVSQATAANSSPASSELALRLAPADIWTSQASLVRRPLGASVPSDEPVTPGADPAEASPVEPEFAVDPQMERALRDPEGFIEELSEVSLAERDQQLSALFAQASRAGRVGEVVQSLRTAGDRRADEIADGFERISTAASR
ncbi:MAG TPA: anti-sigma factor [Myxococcota bacterium]|nr:anti-sigma factor [Myxococcota bacterium]